MYPYGGYKTQSVAQLASVLAAYDSQWLTLRSTASVRLTITNVEDGPVANLDMATVSEDSTDNVIDVLGQ
jgi:hypothetical protein